jgi:GntR family transcriptional regulator
MQQDFFDRESGIPVYRQLADYIKKQISNGSYRPGDVLPSEADYIRDFNVSRTTVRLAFGMITNAGMVRREQGRGTIVVPQVRTQLPFLSSFTEEALHYGRIPSVVLLGKSEEQASPNAANALSLPPDAHVLIVERLRIVDGEPIGLSVSSMNIVRFPGLTKLDFSALSIYSLFETEMGLSILSAKENIRADLAEEKEAHKLKIQPGAPVLRMLRTTFIQGEQGAVVPIEYVEVVFNGSIYSVDVELFRQSGK